MSEKQFKLLSGGFDEKGNPLYLIKDTDMIGDYEICKKVIEQQASISRLEEENEQLKKILYNTISMCEEWYGNDYPNAIINVTLTLNPKMYNEIRMIIKEEV